MFRVGLVTKEGKIISENFDTRDDCDTWILEQDEKLGIRKAIIYNKEAKDREIINF
jgi:hypothetical protein